MNKLHLELLKDNLNALNLSAKWVRHSYELTNAIEIKNDYTNDEFDKFENLTSRYARTVDMFVNKVLRSIDTVESVDIGTTIDIMNRAEKREIVSSAELLHTLKDLRNNIAHEYKTENIPRFFEEVLNFTPILLQFIGNANKYCEKYLNFVTEESVRND